MMGCVCLQSIAVDPSVALFKTEIKLFRRHTGGVGVKCCNIWQVKGTEEGKDFYETKGLLRDALH